LIAAARSELAARRPPSQSPAPPGPAIEALRRAINARDAAGRTPLHLAARRGHLECVRQLARSCAANVFATDHAGCTL
jgi:hypothetical protein